MGSMPASAHNLYIRDDLMYQANYLYGLHVLDVSDPENPREVGVLRHGALQGRSRVRRRVEQLPVFPERHGNRDQHAGGTVHPEEEGAACELRAWHRPFRDPSATLSLKWRTDPLPVRSLGPFFYRPGPSRTAFMNSSCVASA